MTYEFTIHKLKYRLNDVRICEHNMRIRITMEMVMYNNLDIVDK